ncbi:MAG: AIR synthase family protein [Terriglobia bacterium]
MATLRRFPVGKLPPEVLQKLLARCPIPKRSGVVIGPRFGEDAAVLDFGAKYLVAKTDPITFTAERIGWYAVNVNANDIATLGARPRWFLATLLLPEKGATENLAKSIFEDTLRACRQLGITLCGGHTEITTGLDRPIVIGQMLGEVEKSKLVRKERQRPGDLVLLTKGVAIEGTAILAREKAAWIEKKLGGRFVRRAQRLLFHPGISVLRESRIATRHGEIRALHDPTEGGLLSGIYELALAGDVGLRIWGDRIPVLPETRTLARLLGFDPLALIASGALLVVASARTAGEVMAAFARHKVRAVVIGEIRRKVEGVNMVDETGKAHTIRPPARDEIARLLENP